MEKIWTDLAEVDCGPKLVNQFKLHKFIPNKWFDWARKDKVEIMIVGQDWGPYIFLKKYVERYEIESSKANFDYENFLFETFSSRTEKMLLQSLQKSYQEKFGRKMANIDWQKFTFTVAEYFCRSGKLFRGSENFDAKGIGLSLPFLKRQIEIVKPKVILTLGDMALRQVVTAMEIPINYKNLTGFVCENKYIQHNGTIIIPSFHPAAFVDPKLIYEKIAEVWNHLIVGPK